MSDPTPLQEAQDWIVCPVCNSNGAIIDLFSQEVLLDCTECGNVVVVEVPNEPTSI